LEFVLLRVASRAKAVSREQTVMEVDGEVEQRFNQLGFFARRVQYDSPPAATGCRASESPGKKQRSRRQLAEEVPWQPGEMGLGSLVAVMTSVRARHLCRLRPEHVHGRHRDVRLPGIVGLERREKSRVLQFDR